MTTSHTEPPRAAAHATALRGVRRRRRRDWGRGVARFLCVVLAVLGLLPFAATLAVRSAWVRSWAAQKTEDVLRGQGIAARYGLALHVWPLAIELTDVRVDSNDGGAPLLECARTLIRPRLFALLAGKLAIDQIEVDEPRVRLVVKGGTITNFDLPKTPKDTPKKTLHAPFNSFAVTDGSIDLQIDEVHGKATSLDLDVTTDDDASAGSSFEVSARAGLATVQRPRKRADGTAAVDDDALCSIDGRVRIEPNAILVRRFEGVGSADLDAAPGTIPACNLPHEDKRRVEVSLGHLHVALPTEGSGLPGLDGHVRVRAPIALADRFAPMPDMDGWVGLDAEVRLGDDTLLPEMTGTLEAHDVRLLEFRIAQELHTQLSIRRNVISSPLTTIRFADGVVTLSDTVVDPLAKGAKLEKTSLHATNVNFTSLLRDLGVHPHSYVGWDVREVNAPLISGTFAPLKLDGEFTAKTYSFGVYDRPAEDKSRERIFGFPEAQIAARFAVRPEALKFLDIHAALPHSHVDGGLVSIGFNNDLLIDAPRIVADIDDLSPIGPVVMHGKLTASGKVTGTFSNPEPQGDIQSISNFAVADVQFGDLSSGHVKVDVHAPEVAITGVHAQRRSSPYEVPTATLKFGGTHGFVVDAVGTSPGLGLRDFLSMFALDEDPRYDGIDARIAARAEVHVGLGGLEDKCGSGVIRVEGKGHLTEVAIFGEQFARGDADVSLLWSDRDAGIAGADIDVRSFVLSKVEPPRGTRAGATGTILGSASIRRGGALSANVMVEGVPLGRVDVLGSLARDVEGSVSGMAHVTGNLDDFRTDSGVLTRAELDASGIRVRGVALPSSHLQVEMTHRFSPEKRTVGRTRCGAPIAPPFDKNAYLADATSHGEWKVNGELLGGTVRLTDVVATRARAPRMSGRIALRGVDLGPLASAFAERKSDTDDPMAASAPASIGGQIWGELIAEDVPLDDLAHARLSFLPGPTFVSRGSQKLTLRPPPQPIVIANDSLKMPPLEVTLDASGGFSGGFVLTGGATNLTHDPTLALDAQLEPIDLAVLERVLPKVERARGKIEGGLHVTGKASAPTVTGDLHATGDEFAVHGLPSAITDLRLDVAATANELSAKGNAKFAGGTIGLQATLPVRGFEVGALDSHIVARNVRLAPADGIATGVDADLEVTYDGKGKSGEGAALPHVTGDVTIDSFAYTRAISLTTDLGALGSRAKRTHVDTYDPALDALTMDVHVHAPSPLIIKNNLAEVQLAIDSGTLEVTGTNQRVGLRGSLKTLAGGRFHFQGNDFDVRQGLIRFDDATRVAPNVDVTAVTEYRRYTDTSAGAAAGASASGGPSGASVGSTRGGSVWRIALHAYGDADDLKVDMTSEPSLSQEDIVLLLAVGMTRAELDQLQASSIGASIALNYLGASSGADRALKQAVPIIDDFRFGSAYSTVTGKTEPQLTVGKRLTNDIRASVTAGLSEDRELRSNIEWRLNSRLSVQGSYDNINDVSSSAVGNLGVDLRWRLEFE